MRKIIDLSRRPSQVSGGNNNNGEGDKDENDNNEHNQEGDGKGGQARGKNYKFVMRKVSQKQAHVGRMARKTRTTVTRNAIKRGVARGISKG